MSSRGRNKGSGRGGKGGRGGPPPEGKGRGHGLKPRQRREARTEESTDDQKKIDRLRDDLGGLVEMASDAQMLILLKKHDGDIDAVKTVILEKNGVPSASSESDSDDD